MSCTCPNGGRNGHDLDCDEYVPYGFKDKPAQKSSTSILMSTPGNVACPVCGHFMTPLDPNQRPYSGPPYNCGCRCHR